MLDFHLNGPAKSEIAASSIRRKPSLTSTLFFARRSNEFRLTAALVYGIKRHEPYRTVRIWE